MDINSRLDGNSICADCDKMVMTLEQEITNYKSKIQALEKFGNLDISGESVTALKARNNDLIGIINKMIEADELDIRDYKIMQEHVRNVYIIGEEVIENLRKARFWADACYDTAESLWNASENAFLPIEADELRNLSNASRKAGDGWERIYAYWNGQEDLYDSIDCSTSNLFSEGTFARQQTKMMLVDFESDRLSSALPIGSRVIGCNLINGIPQNGKSYTQIESYVMSYLKEHGFSDEQIEDIYSKNPGVFTSLYATMHWSTKDAKIIEKRLLAEYFDEVMKDLKTRYNLDEGETEELLHKIFICGKLEEMNDAIDANDDASINEIITEINRNSNIVNNIQLELQKMPVYGLKGTADDIMPQEQINANAEYIYYYLRNEGWTKEAVCAVLGNIYEESKFNPGAWERLDDASSGYGILQFTAYKGENAFFEYIKNDEYNAVSDYDELVCSNPQKMINYQLEFLLTGNGWYYTNGFSGYFISLMDSEYSNLMPEVVQMPISDFANSNASPEALALIFEASYERSADSLVQKEERAEAASTWYEYFKDYE